MPASRRGPASKRSRSSTRDPVAAVQDDDSFGRLKRINVRRLLGEFSHDLRLPDTGPAILTGANGTGKSTLLRLVNAIGAGDWVTVARLPYERTTLYFDSGNKVEVRRKDDVLHVGDGDRRVSINFSEAPWGAGAAHLAALPPDESRRYRERLAAERNRSAHGFFDYVMTDAYANVVRAFEFKSPPWLSEQEMLFAAPQLRLLEDPDRAFLQQITDRFKVRFITDQRLIMRGDERGGRRADAPASDRADREQFAERVTYYSKKLGQEMTVALGEYANVSQREDGEFPQRVAEELMRNQRVNKEKLLPLMEEVALQREALERVGLVERFPESGFESANLDDPSVSIVFKTFAESTLRKFAVLKDFRTRVELLTSFLNERFVGKQAVPRAESGPRSESGLTFFLSDGGELAPAQLSSGEQQMLVLAYEILFETPPGTLLLIDEPEISLHVLWQSTFVDDIAEMGRSRNLNFLLATHSPALIGGRRDLMRSLDPH